MRLQDAWFEVLFARVTQVNKVAGQASAMFRAILDLFFYPPARDLSGSGALLQLPDGALAHLSLKLHMVIADDVALRGLCVCTEAGGLKNRACLPKHTQCQRGSRSHRGRRFWLGRGQHLRRCWKARVVHDCDHECNGAAAGDCEASHDEGFV